MAAVFVAGCDATPPSRFSQPTVVPSSVTAFTGDTVRLVASVFDRDAAAMVQRPVGWASRDTSIATVDSTGLVTIKKAGSTTIDAAIEGFAVSASVNAATRYTNPTIVPNVGVVMTGGDTLRLSAYFLDSATKTIVVRPATWRSMDTAIVVIDSSGLMRAKYRDGLAHIGVTAEGLELSKSVVVQGTPFVFPDTNVLVPGIQRELRLESFTVQSGLRQVSGAAWSSTNSAVASVDANGRVTAHGTGEATIAAELADVPVAFTAKVYVKAPLTGLRFQQVMVGGG